MSGKTRDFGKLAAGLAGAAPSATARVPAAPGHAEPRGRGRPPAETQAMTLRVPNQLKRALVTAAAQESIRRGTTVTAQEIVLATLRQRFGG